MFHLFPTYLTPPPSFVHTPPHHHTHTTTTGDSYDSDNDRPQPSPADYTIPTFTPRFLPDRHITAPPSQQPALGRQPAAAQHTLPLLSPLHTRHTLPRYATRACCTHLPGRCAAHTHCLHCLTCRTTAPATRSTRHTHALRACLPYTHDSIPFSDSTPHIFTWVSIFIHSSDGPHSILPPPPFSFIHTAIPGFHHHTLLFIIHSHSIHLPYPHWVIVAFQQWTMCNGQCMYVWTMDQWPIFNDICQDHLFHSVFIQCVCVCVCVCPSNVRKPSSVLVFIFQPMTMAPDNGR